MTTWTAQPSGTHVERAILTRMILSDQFIKSIIPDYRPELLAADFAREVAGW